jgi:hypothetical protein
VPIPAGCLFGHAGVIVKQIGEPAMAAIEKGVEVFQLLATQGVAGLWRMLVDKLGDIKEMILEQVKDFVITKIITAGITWLIGLLNPAAAFIKACKLIYDVVMFFVDNASRIMKFVNTILDSVADIVRGNVGGVEKINDVLGQMVPILIGFLASVIGIGGIGQKIRQIVDTLQKPVNKALDFIIKTGLKLAGPFIRGIKGLGAKVKAKVLGGDDSPAGKQKRLDKGMAAGVSAANRFAGRTVGEPVLRPVLGAISMRYGLTVLEPVRQGTKWAVHGEVQRAVLPTQAEADAAAEKQAKKEMDGRGGERWCDARSPGATRLPCGEPRGAYGSQDRESRPDASRRHTLDHRPVRPVRALPAHHDGDRERPIRARRLLVARRPVRRRRSLSARAPGSAGGPRARVGEPPACCKKASVIRKCRAD